MGKPLAAIFIALLLYCLTILFTRAPVYADCSPSCGSIDECKQKIAECTKLLEISVSATRPHAQKVAGLERDINAIGANIASLAKQIDLKKKDIDENEKKLASRQRILETMLRAFYKREHQTGAEFFFITLLTTPNLGETFQVVGYRQSLVDQEKKIITNLVLQITDLAAAKQKLEETQNWLTANRAGLEKTLAPVKDLVTRARAYQSQLSSTVGVLSTRQQELLAEKTGGVFSASVGNVSPSDDPSARPTFDPGFRPAFAGFSFGIPHRYGLSQFGAFGRAKVGQKAEDILTTYYTGVELKKDYSLPGDIGVIGYGRISLDDYMKGIGEVPNSWGDEGGMEAIKAQAVAVRSYALAVTDNGSGSICPTEQCQVYLGYKKGGNWERAVDETKNWVLVKDGKPIAAYYSASAGGFTLNHPTHSHLRGLKDAHSGGWPDDAYENYKYANSPFFYVGCYRPRCLKSRSSSRSHPWLTKDEFVDIVNAVFLFLKDNSALSHLSQTDKPSSDTWSRDEVRQRLGADAVSEVTNASVTYHTSGYTSNVHLETDKGGQDVSGDTFRQIFNIRAPGEIWLASSLFNIEKK